LTGTTLVWSMVSIIQGRLSRTPEHRPWFAVQRPTRQILVFSPGVVTLAQARLRVNVQLVPSAHHVQPPGPQTASQELNTTLLLIALRRKFQALIISCILDNHYQTYHKTKILHRLPQIGVLTRRVLYHLLSLLPRVAREPVYRMLGLLLLHRVLLSAHD
jgi:hypothetical protein